MDAPQSINELKSRLKSVGITDDHLQKFQDAMKENGFDIDDIIEDITDQENSQLFKICRDDMRAQAIYDIVKHIMYVLPVTKTLIMDYSIQNSSYLLEKYYESYPYERLSDDFHIVKWEHIANAMKHELHQKISETFMKIVNDKIKCK
eukprot:513644_1